MIEKSFSAVDNLSMPLRLEYMQNSNAIPIVLNIADYDIPVSAVATFNIKKPSGKSVYDTAKITGNTITINPRATYFDESGMHIAQVQVVDNDVLLTKHIYIEVLKDYTNDKAIVATDDFNALIEATQSMIQASQETKKVTEEARKAISDLNNEALRTETKEDLAAFRREAVNCMASYLMVNYQSDCVKGYTGNQIAYVYDTNQGYMALFGRYLKFNYSDKLDGKNIAYMDCAVFASLIFKCRSYTDSPYHYAFTTTSPTKEELYHRSLENYGMDKPWTFDFLNNLNTGRMIYQAYKAGLTIHKLSERKGANKPITYFEDELKQLETGDIMFRGISGAINETNKGQIFEGVDHAGIFVKSLDELNKAEGVPSGVTFHELTRRTSKYGYIVEFTGATEGRHKNCLRISALEKWSEAVPNGDWTKLFSVKPVSNHMTSNKAHVQATGILKCYDYDVRVLQEMSGYYYKICEIIPRIASGWIIKEHEDLNDYCYDGLYQCNTLSVAQTLKNAPTATTNFDLRAIGFRNGEYGTQIAYCNSSSHPQIYVRTCFKNPSGWSPWEAIAVSDAAWSILTCSTNFVVDGTKPWIHHAKKQGAMVCINLDLTTKYSFATTREYLIVQDLPPRFKPNLYWNRLIYTEQGKRLVLELKDDVGLSIKARPLDDMVVGDRIRTTITYMI